MRFEKFRDQGEGLNSVQLNQDQVQAPTYGLSCMQSLVCIISRNGFSKFGVNAFIETLSVLCKSVMLTNSEDSTRKYIFKHSHIA